jgi:hypothetical protein
MPVSINQSSAGLLNAVILPERWSKELSHQPETGMGFQDVEITTKDGSKVNGFVSNGSHLETVTAVQVDDIVAIKVKRKA